MAKRKPLQRWQDRLHQQYQLFRASKDFKDLRTKGLRTLGRRKLVDTEEWWEAKRKDLWVFPEYRAFQAECRRAADRFGLAAWVPEMACLLKGYSPNRMPGLLYFSGSISPTISVVTTCPDQVFQDWLLWEEGNLSSETQVWPKMRVVFRWRGKESVLLAVPAPSKPRQQLTEGRKRYA